MIIIMILIMITLITIILMIIVIMLTNNDINNAWSRPTRRAGSSTGAARGVGGQTGQGKSTQA